MLEMVLAALVVGIGIWGARQYLLLRRVRDGLVALRQGRADFRARRAPEDREPVLEAFDGLAEQLSVRDRQAAAASASSDLGQVLHRLCLALRPPLVAIQGYAALLKQDSAIGRDPVQMDCLRHLNLQVDGLVRLLESSADLSELRHGLSGLRRDIMTQVPVASGRTTLLIDQEGGRSAEIARLLSDLGIKVLVAPGADAATIMAQAVRPILVLINATRPDGLGWRALGSLKRTTETRAIPVWLYGLDLEARTGQLWAPQEVWLWPGDSDTLAALSSWSPERAPIGFLGDPELGAEVERVASIRLVPSAPVGAVPVLERCLTLLGMDQPEEAPGPRYALVIPEAALADRGADLVHTFQKSVQACPVDLESLGRELVERARRELPGEVAASEDREHGGK